MDTVVLTSIIDAINEVRSIEEGCDSETCRALSAYYEIERLLEAAGLLKPTVNP